MSTTSTTLAADDSQPLSHRQRMIWTGQMLDPDIPLYNMAHAFTIEASLDAAAFEQAFVRLVANCDALRTVVVEHDGVPAQRVLERLEPTVELVDLRNEPDPERAAVDWADRRAGERFDLERPMFDTALLRLGPERHVWFLNQHHLICDAWSVSLLLKLQGDYYRLALEGRLDEAEAPPPYGDFLAAESASIGSKAQQRAEAYWQGRELVAEPPLTFYGPRPDHVGAETVRVHAAIEGARAERLARFMADPDFASMTPELTALKFFQTVLAAYLQRICGNDRVVIGTPFHNRAKRQAKATVGLCMNLFPVAVTVADETGETDETGVTMSRLADRLGAETFDCLQHARFPSDAHSGSFEAVLNYLHIPHEHFDGIEVGDRWVHPGAGDQAHSLRLQVRRQGDDEFRLYFDVKTALFNDSARQALVQHFLAIVDRWLDDLHVPLAEIDLLSADERAHLLQRFNQHPDRGVQSSATGATVIDDFEQVVASWPERVAVVDGDRTVSYGQLNRWANRLAHHLRDRGVGTGHYVGLHLPRGAEAVAAMLAVLKAGAAYVPIEPGTPSARLAQIVGDTDLGLVCTDDHGAQLLQPTGITAVLVDEFDDGHEGPDENPAISRSGSGMAYAIFTSGSTGIPKGVPIHHRGLANYVRWAVDQYTDGQPRAFALFTSLAFDLTITSVFVPLSSGGSVVTYPDDTGGTPTVVQVWNDDRVDVVKATPSHLAIVAQLERSASRVKVLIVGGEDFATDLAARVQRLHPQAEIFNEYGPTETVVGCMIHRFDPERDRRPSVPIGRPAANAEILVLDRRGAPVPPGVIGEIHIGGPGVADGYLRRPVVSAERFVERPAGLPTPQPTGQQGAEREDVNRSDLYRSGDLARWSMDDGPPRLEFLGRADNQVKLRGYRIELGEIEAVLAGHPEVESAAATVVSETVGAAPTPADEVLHCVRCGLPSNFPDASFDDDVCSLCRDYDSYRDKVDEYFKDQDELVEVAARIKAQSASRSEGDYDCLVLLSGGKDSTYMLYQVVALGLRPLVFTLDNGFISPSALANCRRVCEHLGVDLHIGRTEHMNEIFRDSLDRFANVCNGCFKTIYTLSMNLARANGIGHIITGLARGQLFETRLSDMYNHRIFDVERIDEYVLEARKAYHHIDDSVSQLLDVSAFADDRIFDEIEFIDYYRYADVALDEVLGFLAQQTPWARPADTGRSTNCLINDVGIHVHNRERGFHNYALPYSWDVRLGHKERDAALDELDDDIDLEFVNEVLVEIGYKPKPPPEQRHAARLVAHYQSPEPCDEADLRATLAAALPEYMLPSAFVHHASLPLTVNGKIDRAALPLPGRSAQPSVNLEALDGEQERALKILGDIWSTIFDQPVEPGQNFFDLGGDSIIAIQIVDRAAGAGLALTPRQLFEAETLVGAAVAAVDRTPDGPTPVTPPAPAEAVTLRAADGSYPLTPTQSGMLFHSLAEPEAGLYQGQIVHHLRGRIDDELLARCWLELVERQPVMRTVIDWGDAEHARQRVDPTVDPRYRKRRWADCSSESDFEVRLQRFLDEDRADRFDLRTEPAARLTLIGSPIRSVMVWSFHHIAFDGWSIALAMNELLDSYQAKVEQRRWEPPVRRPFADYLDWLAAQDGPAAEAFWTDHLAGFAEPTALPRSAAAPTERGYGAHLRGLGAPATGAVIEFARAQRVTISTVLQAAWGLTLARYEQSDDVVFGVTTSGRPPTLGGAESMVGMLVTTLPTRVRVPADRTPGEWLRELQATQLAVRDHEYASLVDVQRWSEAPSGRSLFESILVVENFPDYQPPSDPEALAVTARDYRVQSNYPLSLIVLPGDELTLKLVYDPGWFPSRRMLQMLDHLEAVVASLVAGDAATVTELQSVSAAERAVLEDWGKGITQRDPKPDELGFDPSQPPSLPEMIRRRAQADPDAPAVVCGHQQLSYGRLWSQATEVATALRANGVGPNSFVAVMSERSPEMVVALVAVMEAGAAYLPLDPAYPADRLRFMLTDAEASLLLSTTDQEQSVASLGLEAGSPSAIGDTSLTLRPSGLGRTDPDRPPEGEPAPISGDDPAYIIYTSGSTGTANGVPISNDNLAFSTAARFQSYPEQPSAFLLLSSFSFDSSVVGLFWTLAAGGQLVLPEPGQELDMPVLVELIESHAVSHTLCLPSLYRLLLEAGPADRLRSLNTVIVAGEACDRALVTAHAAALPGTDLYNEYGPTEATVWATVHRCDPGGEGPVPIGRPIPGAVAAVLDPAGRPSGIGVPGELYLGGPGLAAGYHRRPQLSAERFVEIDGRRWFRTRDRATMEAGGRIDFGGRTDSQVKIRGFRVELGEVEAALVDQPEVSLAAVTVDHSSTGGPRLVALVEPEPGSDPAPDVVKAAVAERLPAAFVPFRVVVLDRLPRLPNGKVDHSALPRLTPEAVDVTPTLGQAPTGPEEELVAEIWSGLLPGVSIGRHGDFFDIGGHSLLAVSMVESIRRRTGVEIRLAELLERPTVAGLASLLADRSGADSSPGGQGQQGHSGPTCLVPLRSTGDRIPLYLIPPAAGTALSFREFVANADPGQPLYGFEPLGNDGISEPHDTVEAMAGQYVSELVAAQPDGRYRIGGSCLGAIVAWEMAAQLERAGTPVELLVFLDPGPPHSGPGWTYQLPTQRSPKEFIRSALDIVTGGELLTAVKAVWRRNRFDRIGRIHYRAQLSYVADRLQAPIIWLESEELANDQPLFLEQWRILAGDDLNPIVVPNTTHDGLMTGQPGEVAAMTELFNRAMADFDRSAP